MKPHVMWQEMEAWWRNQSHVTAPVQVTWHTLVEHMTTRVCPHNILCWTRKRWWMLMIKLWVSGTTGRIIMNILSIAVGYFSDCGNYNWLWIMNILSAEVGHFIDCGKLIMDSELVYLINRIKLCWLVDFVRDSKSVLFIFQLGECSK